ncbi:MAG: M23 family metallopeptidase [Erysipelotrichaceae bacterium]|nr:M23 family metallopeptidase [Erysipelotrichaceae bacterium]
MKLKSFVFPVLYISLIFTVIVGLYFTSKVLKQSDNNSLKDITYVSKTILDNTIPVISVDDTISNPYTGDNVKIARYFYNLEDDMDRQKESIVYYNDTYMQSSGIDYTSENSFDVISILEGVVIDIKEDELLGKIVEIKHTNELVSSYAGLSEINVSKGENITKDMKIGKSGSNKINESLGNHLHFEVYKNGVNIDPLKVIGKKLGDI